MARKLAACLSALLAGLASAEEAPPPANPLSFGATNGDWMVLQQAPAKSAVSGVLNKSGSGPVEVAVSGGSGAAYKVHATVTKLVGGGYKWKAFLRPTKAGGDFTITARNGALTAQISHVTFGDVWC
jgi:hypothetical protein